MPDWAQLHVGRFLQIWAERAKYLSLGRNKKRTAIGIYRRRDQAVQILASTVDRYG